MATLSFPLNAGLLVRGELNRIILAYCFSNGLKYEVQEDKGLLESLYLFKLHGTDEQIKKAHKFLIGLLELTSSR